jgi:hypothetical protein
MHNLLGNLTFWLFPLAALLLFRALRRTSEITVGEPAAANCSSDRPAHYVIERLPAFSRFNTDACRA